MQAFVIGFDTTPEVTQDFTDNTEALSKGVRMLRPGGGTAMYDAIYYACRDQIMANDKGPTATRRAIILLSDGDDNQSRVSREEAVEMAQKAEVIIYTISTNTSGQRLKGDKVLEHFAEETGGRAFFPFKIQDVSDAFSQIQDELRSQYAISYKPADLQPNGKYHTIQILADNKKYKVRARKGYYAPTAIEDKSDSSCRHLFALNSTITRCSRLIAPPTPLRSMLPFAAWHGVTILIAILRQKRLCSFRTSTKPTRSCSIRCAGRSTMLNGTPQTVIAAAVHAVPAECATGGSTADGAHIAPEYWRFVLLCF